MFGLSPIEMVVIGGITILLIRSRLPPVARSLANSHALWVHMLDDNPYRSPDGSPLDPDVRPFGPGITSKKLLPWLMLAEGVFFIATIPIYLAIGADIWFCLT